MNESKSVTSESKSVGELSREYLDWIRQKKATPQDISTAQQEVLRFVRWFNPDQPLRTLRPSDIERFVEEVARTAAGSPGKLQPVRDMLAYAKKQGYTDENLGTHVRIRRTIKRDGKKEVREQQQIQMTAEGLAHLKADLQSLVGQRPAIAEELSRAMADKDFRENAPLDAARDRQAQVEARIRDLEAQVRLAVVVKNDERAERVTLGRTVTLIDLEEEDQVRFVLVSPNEVDIRAGRISTSSPTGRMLVDRQVGDEISVEAPVGQVRYRIVNIE